MAKDPKIEGINFFERALKNKKVFKRLLIFLVIAGIIGVAGIASWKGCEINTPKGSISVKAKKEAK